MNAKAIQLNADASTLLNVNLSKDNVNEKQSTNYQLQHPEKMKTSVQNQTLTKF